MITVALLKSFLGAALWRDLKSVIAVSLTRSGG